MAAKNKMKGLVLATAGLAGIVSGCSTIEPRVDVEKLIQERDAYKAMFEVNNSILKLYEKYLTLDSYKDKVSKESLEHLDEDIGALEREITNLGERLDTYLEKKGETK